MSNKYIVKNDENEDLLWKFINDFSNTLKPLMFGDKIQNKDILDVLNDNMSFFTALFEQIMKKSFDVKESVSTANFFKYCRFRFFDIHGEEIFVDYNGITKEWEKFKKREEVLSFSDNLYRHYYSQKESRKTLYIIVKNDQNDYYKQINEMCEKQNHILVIPAEKKDGYYELNLAFCRDILGNISDSFEEVYKVAQVEGKKKEDKTGLIDVFYQVDIENTGSCRLLCTVTFSLNDQIIKGNKNFKSLENLTNINKAMKNINGPIKSISVLLSSALLTSETFCDENEIYLIKCGNKIWDILFNNSQCLYLESSKSELKQLNILKLLHSVWQKLVTPSCRGKLIISKIIYDFFITKYIQMVKENNNDNLYLNDVLNTLDKPLREMLDFEDKLKLAGFRDHFIHSFHVFLLGLLIWPFLFQHYKEKQFLRDSELWGEKCELIWGIDYFFLHKWFITSFWHDISYSLSTTSKWLSEIVRKLLNLNSEKIRSMHIHTDIFANEHYYEALRYLSDKLSEKGSNIIHNLIERQVEKGMKYCDHGLLSSIMTLGLLYIKSHEIPLEKISDCFIAIAIHDSYWKEFKPADETLRKIVKEKPLSILLSICDEIQCWGRFGEEKDLEFKDIFFKENQLKIIFSPKENNEKGKKNIKSIYSNIQEKANYFFFETYSVKPLPDNINNLTEIIWGIS